MFPLHPPLPYLTLPPPTTPIFSDYFEEVIRQSELTEQILAAQHLLDQEEANVLSAAAAAAPNKDIDNLKKPLPNKSPKGLVWYISRTLRYRRRSSRYLRLIKSFY